jgi:DNA modification methylase
LGQEKTFQEYINKLCDIFDEVKRVLRKDGTCFINIGDTYIGNRATRHKGYVDPKYPNGRIGGDCEPIGLKQTIESKNLTLIPFRFAIEMQNRGWIVRNTIIWHKPSSMPESVKDRFTVDFEYVFFFVKSQKYYFEQQLDEFALSTIKKAKRGVYFSKNSKIMSGNYAMHGDKTVKLYQKIKSGEIKGRNKRCVWSIASKPFRGAHFAIFPPDLIEPMIKAGCPKDGIVLDPFIGSGTTAVVAKKLFRNYVGIELNPKYIKMAEERLTRILL